MELNNEDDGRATPRTVLGRRLRRLREAADLSQRALADKVGYPHTYLSRVERGEQLPSEALAEDLDTYFRHGRPLRGVAGHGTGRLDSRLRPGHCR